MREKVFRTQVNAAVEDVAEFYRHPDAFKHLAPPLVIQVHRNEGIAEQSIVEFSLWLGPVPVRWIARHSDVDFDTGFTDTQVSGPFTSWVHRHTYHPVKVGQTEIVDEISAVFGKSIFYRLVSRLMWLGLPVLFAYRRWATRRQVRKIARERAKRTQDLPAAGPAGAQGNPYA